LTLTQLETPKWTAQEFERLVLDCNPKVAVFDCDGTLWGGDAGYGFMVWSLEQGLVSRSTSDWIDTRHRAYQQGHVSELDICGEMVQIYAGLRDQELRDKAGVKIWAVSSTNKWVVAEGVRDFGISEDHVLAAEVRVKSGIITTEILDVPTDEGKATTLRRIGLNRPDAAFGNSIHDLAMLEIARCAFPVNPSPALLQAAAKNGWGYFRPLSAEGAESAVAGE
jgi:phosphoserine phosphatase